MTATRCPRAGQHRSPRRPICAAERGNTSTTTIPPHTYPTGNQSRARSRRRVSVRPDALAPGRSSSIRLDRLIVTFRAGRAAPAQNHNTADSVADPAKFTASQFWAPAGCRHVAQRHRTARSPSAGRWPDGCSSTCPVESDHIPPRPGHAAAGSRFAPGSRRALVRARQVMGAQFVSRSRPDTVLTMLMVATSDTPDDGLKLVFQEPVPGSAVRTGRLPVRLISAY
jgi:hypothetical protein